MCCIETLAVHGVGKEHQARHEYSIWGNSYGVHTTKFDAAALDSFISLVRILNSSSNEEENSKVPEPKA